MQDAIFSTDFPIEFGDCDPAGIVFYPRFFGWFDATFQRWLRERGEDQASIRKRFGAAGTGLMEADARFQAPLRPGDTLTIAIVALDWGERSLRVAYRGTKDGRPALEGHETRGLFVPRADGTLRAAPLVPLRELLEG